MHVSFFTSGRVSTWQQLANLSVTGAGSGRRPIRSFASSFSFVIQLLLILDPVSACFTTNGVLMEFFDDSFIESVSTHIVSRDGQECFEIFGFDYTFTSKKCNKAFVLRFLDLHHFWSEKLDIVHSHFEYWNVGYYFARGDCPHSPSGYFSCWRILGADVINWLGSCCPIDKKKDTTVRSIWTRSQECLVCESK